MFIAKRFILVALIVVVCDEYLGIGFVHGSSFQYYSLERNSNNIIDDGNRNVIEIKQAARALRPQKLKKHELQLDKRIKLINKLIALKQKKTNQVGVGLEMDRRKQLFELLKRIKKVKESRRRLTKRTVQSPAKSTDSGGHTSGSLSSEIAKLFHAEPKYANFYDKLDHPNARNTTTSKRPADVVEELMRDEATHIYRLQEEKEKSQPDRRFRF